MMEWNHVDMAQVGGSSVITVKVYYTKTDYKIEGMIYLTDYMTGMIFKTDYKTDFLWQRV